VGAELLHSDRRTDEHTVGQRYRQVEAKSNFSRLRIYIYIYIYIHGEREREGEGEREVQGVNNNNILDALLAIYI